jgi:hypothetical protein
MGYFIGFLIIVFSLYVIHRFGKINWKDYDDEDYFNN